MSDSTQQARAEQLRQWHRQPPILLLPNAWDAASARIFAQLGFRAVATTSSGVAIANGYPDGERMPRALMIETIRRVAAAVDCPVTADIEAGYGESLDQKLDTIRQVVEAGAVGVNIEDSLEHGAPAMVSQTAQTELIAA
ncbi:MAG TPA: isocitrate lyase/phosphoenolpyruvate mutase family protein, partial [Ktedonobacterales bacterium]